MEKAEVPQPCQGCRNRTSRGYCFTCGMKLVAAVEKLVSEGSCPSYTPKEAKQ